VRRVEEPARTTIVSGFLRGLSSVEVDRRMGYFVSDGDGAWRTQKALDELAVRRGWSAGSARREAWLR
jgi:hypothetical protein